MSERFPGGLITKTPVTPSGPYESDTASGIWTLDQQMAYTKQGIWPTAGRLPPDPQFNYVTMLLHGDGTNGAQNNTFVDSSTNNFTITRVGNTTQGSYSPFGSNWSNFFNGTDANLVFANNANLNLGSGDFTLECWFYHLTGTGNGVIWSQWNNGGDNSGQLLTNGTGLIYRIGATQWSFGTFVANNWTHVAVTRSGSTVRMFVNGVVASTQTNSTNITTTGATIIGANDNGTANFFNGYISNFRQVKGTAVYTSNFTPSTTPLTAITNTQLLTCQSNRFIDNSSNAFFPSINGTPNIQRFNPFGASTAYSTSVIGGSGYFDGSGDYLSIASNAALTPANGDFTFEAWVYFPDNTGDYGLYCGATGTGSMDIRRVGNTLRLGRYNTAFDNTSSTINIANTWAHLAISRSGTSLYMFCNGVSIYSGSNSINYPSGGVTIGSDNGECFALGYISNLRFVKGTALYTTAFTPPTAPVTAVSGTSVLTNFTNGAIFDNAMMNDLETVGNVQISTSVKKFGTGSLAFDGTGDYLKARYNPWLALGTGDYTIELWINFSSVSTSVFVGDIDSSGNGNWAFFYNSSVGVLRFLMNNSSVQLSSSSWTPSTSTWYHIAICRASGTYRFFVNGTVTGSGSDSTNITWGTNNYYVGSASDGGLQLNGYIDDLRITKGYARYTTTFTPPTAAFPNIGPT